MEILGVDLVAVQQTLLMVVTPLLAGLLAALVMTGWPWRMQLRPIVILEPAPTPEQLPATVGSPSRWLPACESTRAPPVVSTSLPLSLSSPRRRSPGLGARVIRLRM